MIRAYSARQIRHAEAPLLAADEPLMQRAAAGLADHIGRLLTGTEPGRALILAGSGNNGGDALFAGARLAAAGHVVTVLPVGRRLHDAGAAAAAGAGARVVAAADRSAATAAALAAAADVVVDGILGTGATPRPALRGLAAEAVTAILPVLSADRAPAVVAVDLPSGVDADDGGVADPTVLPARVTVTFGAYKAGLLLEPGARFAGHVELVDIGLGPLLAGEEPLLESEGPVP